MMRFIKKFLWFEFLFFFANLLTVTLFYKNILLTTAILILITVVGQIRWKSFRTLIIFILAGIIGTFGEMLAIYAGAWTYNITNFFNIPIWLFILWGNAASFIYQVAKKFKERKL